MNNWQDWQTTLELKTAPENKDEIFNEIWERHYKGIFFYVSRNRGIGREACEDLTQECFMKAYRSIESYNTRFSLKTWLYSIARNLCIDYFRKNNRQSEYLSTEEVPDVKTELTPEKLFLVSEKKDRWKEHLESRPVDVQQILFLRLEEKLSYREIAESSGKPEGTIRSIVHHERKKAEILFKED